MRRLRRGLVRCDAPKDVMGGEKIDLLLCAGERAPKKPQHWQLC